MSGRFAQGMWEGQNLMWQMLEMLAVFHALKHFLPDLRGHHVLVRTDNTLVVSYINRQEGLHSRPLCRLAHQILLWAQGKLLSLRADYIPGHLNQGAYIMSRHGQRPGEWRLHPEVVELLWREFGQAEVDLFASQETTHCPALVVPHASSSAWAGCHGADVAEVSSVRFSPDRSAPESSGKSTPGRGPSSASSPVLASLSMVLRPCVPPRRLSAGDSDQEGPPLSVWGHHPSPLPGLMETVGVAPEGAQLIASGLSTEVVETILQSRAPTTRKL